LSGWAEKPVHAAVFGSAARADGGPDIYGPEYTAEANLTRLRTRGLGHKRSLALREFALGIEALERFVALEPLYRVHECVFGVLALESEPVDPRL
jgi:protein phosphatase